MMEPTAPASPPDPPGPLPVQKFIPPSTARTIHHTDSTPALGTLIILISGSYQFLQTYLQTVLTSMLALD